MNPRNNPYQLPLIKGKLVQSSTLLEDLIVSEVCQSKKAHEWLTWQLTIGETPQKSINQGLWSLGFDLRAEIWSKEAQNLKVDRQGGILAASSNRIQSLSTPSLFSYK